MSELSLYRRLLQSELQRLNEICGVWRDKQNNANLPDHVCGLIRSAIGKAHLLIRGKLKQFGGLIEECENGCEEKTITVPDLQGYWDLICIEIADVNSSFLMLDRLKNNSWVEVQETAHETKRLPLGIKNVKTFSKTSGFHSAAARKRLAEAKKEMKALKNDKADRNDTMLFEIPVFFSIRSPVKGNKEATICANIDKQGETTPKKTAKTTIKDYSPIMRVTEMKTFTSKEK